MPYFSRLPLNLFLPCTNEMTLRSTSYGRLLLTSFHFHAANCLTHHHNAFTHMTLGREGCHFLTGLAMPVLVAPDLHFHFIAFLPVCQCSSVNLNMCS